MKLLTTAAMALALTGAAAAAQADQPQNQQQQQGQHQGGHQGGGQPHGRAGGQPNYRAAPHNFGGPPPGGQHNFAGPQGGARYNGGQVQQFNGQRGGAGFNGQANGQVQQGYGHYRRGPGAGPGYNGQANGQVQQWNGQRGGAGYNGQVRQWNGQRGGAGVNAQVRAGFGFQSHGLRGRDQGRSYFSANSFARRYQAQRRFRFGGYRYRPNGWYFRTWNFGDFLPYGWFAPNYYLDWADYGLPPPPVGCEWIAQGPDAVLVDIWTGEVLSVYSGVFYWNGY